MRKGEFEVEDGLCETEWRVEVRARFWGLLLTTQRLHVAKVKSCWWAFSSASTYGNCYFCQSLVSTMRWRYLQGSDADLRTRSTPPGLLWYPNGLISLDTQILAQFRTPCLCIQPSDDSIASTCPNKKPQKLYMHVINRSPLLMAVNRGTAQHLSVPWSVISSQALHFSLHCSCIHGERIWRAGMSKLFMTNNFPWTTAKTYITEFCLQLSHSYFSLFTTAEWFSNTALYNTGNDSTSKGHI